MKSCLKNLSRRKLNIRQMIESSKNNYLLDAVVHLDLVLETNMVILVD